MTRARALGAAWPHLKSDAYRAGVRDVYGNRRGLDRQLCRQEETDRGSRTTTAVSDDRSAA